MSDLQKFGIILACSFAWMLVGYAIAYSKPRHIQEDMSTSGSASAGRLIMAIGWPFFLFTGVK